MYTRLDTVKDELKGNEAYKPAAGVDQTLMRHIRTVHQRIAKFGFEFEPLYKTKKITPSGYNINSDRMVLDLDDRLLEVKAITVNGISPVWGTGVLPYPDEGQFPIHYLRIATPGQGTVPSWYARVSNANQLIESIQIAGFWGLRTEYTALGWFDSAITCPALNATQPSFVVTWTVTDADLYGRVPIFSPGNLLRIDDELIELTAVNTSTKTLSGLRGQRGTTAASHAVATAIRIWEPEEAISQVATRQACLLFARRGAYGVLTMPDGTSLSYPNDLLAELRATVSQFNYV